MVSIDAAQTIIFLASMACLEYKCKDGTAALPVLCWVHPVRRCRKSRPADCHLAIRLRCHCPFQPRCCRLKMGDHPVSCPQCFHLQVEGHPVNRSRCYHLQNILFIMLECQAVLLQNAAARSPKGASSPISTPFHTSEGIIRPKEYMCVGDAIHAGMVSAFKEQRYAWHSAVKQPQTEKAHACSRSS